VPIKSAEEQTAGMFLKTQGFPCASEARRRTPWVLTGWARDHRGDRPDSGAKQCQTARRPRQASTSSHSRLASGDEQANWNAHRKDRDARHQIVEALKADDVAHRLTTIPGVGPITTATARAIVQDPAAFRTGRDLCA